MEKTTERKTKPVMEVEQQLGASKDGEQDDCVPLPGFRFHPTDEELVGFYLKRKVDKKPIRFDLIKHIDVYKYEPWDLPRMSGVGEREWYFFCRRGRKYKNSVRPNRVTGCGFWKATGIDKPIFSVGKLQECIGLKKSLVYYRGSAGKGTKTDWMMHEFRLPATRNSNTNFQEAEVWTLCRIFKRDVPNKKYASQDWQKYFSSQRPKTGISSGSHDNGDKYQSLENPGGLQVMNDPFCESNQLLYDQLNLSTDDEGSMSASCLSFSSPNGDALIDRSWDELRPMVEFALDPAMLYSFRYSE